MAEPIEASTSISDGQRLSLRCNRPSRDELLRQPSLVYTRTISGTGPTPFLAKFQVVEAYSWPFRVGLKNHSFMRFFKGTIPQSKRLPRSESHSGDQKCIGPSHVKAESCLSDLSFDYGSGKQDEYDEDLFAPHKYIQEEDRNNKGGIDTEEREEEETRDDSKDFNQVKSAHLFVDSEEIQQEGSDNGEPDSEDEDEKYGYFDQAHPADLCPEEGGSMPAHLTLSDADGDDDEFIVFSDNPEVVDTNPACNGAGQDIPTQFRSLVHTVSYSSDESGFCENITDSSDGEECEGSESEDDEVGVVLDEELWRELEQQVHFFVGIKPLRNKPGISTPRSSRNPSVTPHKSALPEHHTNDTTICTDGVRKVPESTCLFDGETCNSKNTADVSARDLSSSSLPLHKARKSVSFKSDPELVKVHLMVTWQFAHRACRRGPWEQIARDRDRFRARIEHTAKILNPCLKKHPSHM